MQKLYSIDSWMSTFLATLLAEESVFLLTGERNTLQFLFFRDIVCYHPIIPAKDVIP